MVDILKLQQRRHFPGNFIPLHSSDGQIPSKKNVQPKYLQRCWAILVSQQSTPAAPDAARWLSPASRARAVTDVPVLAHGRLEPRWPTLCRYGVEVGGHKGVFGKLSGCSSAHSSLRAFSLLSKGPAPMSLWRNGGPDVPEGPRSATSTKFKPAAPGASCPASSALPARGDSGTPPSGPSRRSWKTFRTASQLSGGSAPSEAAARSRTARVRTPRRKLFLPMARDRRQLPQGARPRRPEPPPRGGTARRDPPPARAGPRPRRGPHAQGGSGRALPSARVGAGDRGNCPTVTIAAYTRSAGSAGCGGETQRQRKR